MPSRAQDEAEPSDRVRAAVAGADADGLLDRENKNLAIADAASAGGVLDRFDRAVGKVVLNHHLDFHLGEEIDDIFGTAIELGMALLPAEAFHLSDGDAGDADFVERVFHIVEFERLDDRFDLLHAFLSLSM